MAFFSGGGDWRLSRVYFVERIFFFFWYEKNCRVPGSGFGYGAALVASKFLILFAEL